MSTDTLIRPDVDEKRQAITRLSKDLANAAKTMTKHEARLLVSFFYDFQDQRIRAAGQTRAAAQDQEPHDIFIWMTSEAEVLENQIKRALEKFMQNDPVGVWASSICGIGPVITAGLLANVNIEKCNVCTKLWAYAGLSPGQKRARGQKANWNDSLKRLAFLIGESFVKVQNNDNDTYGKLYVQRKAYEQKKNEAGEYADQAREALNAKKYGKGTIAYRWYSGLWVLDPTLNPSIDAETAEQIKAELKTVAAAAKKAIPEDTPKSVAEEIVEAAKTEVLEKFLGDGFTLRPMLPPAHIHRRAARFCTKLFLSNYHCVAYFDKYKELPAQPYALAHLGHVDFIPPPNAHLIPGLSEALAKAKR